MEKTVLQQRDKMITSASNEKIKYINKLREKAKFRREEGLFVVEGINIFVELDLELVEEVLVSESFENKYLSSTASEAIKPDWSNVESLKSGKKEYIVLSDSVFKKVSDTITPQGVLALVKTQSKKLEDVVESSANAKSKAIVLERLQDPGNMGTIIRTAEAAGVDFILVSSDSVDVYNPKVVRATMGGILRMPIIVSDDVLADIEWLKTQEYDVYAAHLKGTNLYDIALSDRRIFLIGNESKGLSDEISQAATGLIKIPMEGQIESLNAAVAAAILMYQK